MKRLGYTRTSHRAATGVRSSPNRWVCWRLRSCSASTPTFLACTGRNRQRGAVRCAGAGGSLGRGERVRANVCVLLSPRAIIRLPAWERARRRCTALRIHPSASPLVPRPRRCSYKLIARVLRRATEGLTRDDILDNITIAWLTNTGVSGARLYWEKGKSVFHAEGRRRPGCRERPFPTRLYPAPGAGRSGRIPN